ncbi:MAG: histidine phosphatase family protein [Candidatus Micrarchaeaceae archaeon]|jgi:broad specificity phosphatase PhoE
MQKPKLESTKTDEPKYVNTYLLRHGETPLNANRTHIGGRTNSTPLSERGVLQANALGERLLREEIFFDYIYASPAVRTMHTANIVAQITGFKGKIESNDQIQEIDEGDWQGKERAKVHTPEMLSEIRANPLTFRPPNGESQKDVSKRMYEFIERITFAKLENLKESINVGVFGHGYATKCLLMAIMKSDPALTYKIAIANCSITQIRYTLHQRHPGWHIITVNDFSHIVPLGYTVSERIG